MVALDDLLAMKRAAGRPQDLVDASKALARGSAAARPARRRVCASLRAHAEMASPQTLTTPQRLAAIREQMSLLTDYL